MIYHLTLFFHVSKHLLYMVHLKGGRDYNTVDMSRIKMYNEYFPPFQQPQLIPVLVQ
jgi:hypothetical protein